MVAAAFTPEKAEEMRGGIQAKVDELMDDLENMKGQQDTLDLAENFSLPVPFKVCGRARGRGVREMEEGRGIEGGGLWTWRKIFRCLWLSKHAEQQGRGGGGEG